MNGPEFSKNNSLIFVIVIKSRDIIIFTTVCRRLDPTARSSSADSTEEARARACGAKHWWRSVRHVIPHAARCPQLTAEEHSTSGLLTGTGRRNHQWDQTVAVSLFYLLWCTFFIRDGSLYLECVMTNQRLHNFI